jgi:hypothetical protein
MHHPFSQAVAAREYPGSSVFPLMDWEEVVQSGIESRLIYEYCGP